MNHLVNKAFLFILLTYSSCALAGGEGKSVLCPKPISRSRSLDFIIGANRDKVIRDCVEAFFEFKDQVDARLKAEKEPPPAKASFRIEVTQLDQQIMYLIIDALGPGSVLGFDRNVLVVYTTEAKVMRLQQFQWLEAIDCFE